MSAPLEAGIAIYVAMAVALSVWIGVFVYLWRIDAQARALRKQLEREHREERPAAPPAVSLTRVREARPEGEAVEK